MKEMEDGEEKLGIHQSLGLKITAGNVSNGEYVGIKGKLGM